MTNTPICRYCGELIYGPVCYWSSTELLHRRCYQEWLATRTGWTAEKVEQAEESHRMERERQPREGF